MHIRFTFQFLLFLVHNLEAADKKAKRAEEKAKAAEEKAKKAAEKAKEDAEQIAKGRFIFVSIVCIPHYFRSSVQIHIRSCMQSLSSGYR